MRLRKPGKRPKGEAYTVSVMPDETTTPNADKTARKSVVPHIRKKEKEEGDILRTGPEHTLVDMMYVRANTIDTKYHKWTAE